jgi:hypothetical protein
MQMHTFAFANSPAYAIDPAGKIAKPETGTELDIATSGHLRVNSHSTSFGQHATPCTGIRLAGAKHDD